MKTENLSYFEILIKTIIIVYNTKVTLLPHVQYKN